MSLKSSFKLAAALAALACVAALAPAQQSQETTRNRPSRRATNPVPQRQVGPAPTPMPVEPSVVRTAEDVGAQDEPEAPPRRRTPAGRTTRRNTDQPSEQDELRGTVNRLSQTVDKLSDEFTAMRGEQRMLAELERLTRAEQRAESLRSQLRDVTDKEFMLQDRLAQLEAEMQPDAIERRSALIGTLNPAAQREQIRLSFERERDRVQRQLEMIGTSRTRLESAVATAEQEVERLKARVDAMEQPLTDANAQAARPAPTPASDKEPEPPRE
jgi:predicted RNase H-like nuclease (RuvC/YqgF family)